MKTISKKQFENAVQKVLSDGKSIFVVSEKKCPLYWARSKGYCNLRGSIPQYSKYLGNIGRGGKESEQYLVCSLAPGYVISETKSEAKKRISDEKIAFEVKKNKSKGKYSEKKQAEILESQMHGISVKELRSKKIELKGINEKLYEQYLQKENAIISEFNFQLFKIVDKVKLARVIYERGIKIGTKSLKEIL